MFTTETLATKTVEFVYGGNTRTVTVEQVKDCANGAKLLIGRDHDRQMNYRSFDLTKMTMFKTLD